MKFDARRSCAEILESYVSGNGTLKKSSTSLNFNLSSYRKELDANFIRAIEWMDEIVGMTELRDAKEIEIEERKLKEFVSLLI